MSANTFFVFDYNLLWEALVILHLYRLDPDPWLSSVYNVLELSCFREAMTVR